MNILNKRAPLKDKLVRANNYPFMNKTLTKSSMTRSRLENKFLKNPNEENKSIYNKQRNYWWKKALDKKNIAGAVLTDLSKAFDCLTHELLTAKLEAYGFSYTPLNIISSYLSGRK